MSKEELAKLTVKQLDEMCKERNLPRYKGKTHLNKTEMINNLIETKVEETNESKSEDFLAKISYIEKAEVGRIVAFKDKRGLTRSGKIILNDRGARTLQVALKSTRVFFVSYEDIVWVTSEDNRRWPKDVLRELKESQAKIEKDFKERQEKSNKISNNDLQNLSKKMMGAR